MDEMDSNLLPPRGIFVPSQLIYGQRIRGNVLQTWIQLRGLAWKTGETPIVTYEQLSEIMGKSPSTIFSHIDILKSIGALRKRPMGDSRIIVTFNPVDSNDGG